MSWRVGSTRSSPERACSVTEPTVSLDARAGAREALVATGVLLVLLGAGKHLVAVWGAVGSLFFTAVAAFQIYVPLWLIQRRGELPESYGIHVHGAVLGPVAALRRFVVTRLRAAGRRGTRPGIMRRTLALYGRGAQIRPGPFARDAGQALVAAAMTFPPFAVAHHVWQVHVLRGGDAAYAFTVPGDLAQTLLQNTLLVALPEEMFYRGFVEHRLDRLWPTRRMVWLVPLSRTVVVTSALFALGHFLGEYNPARLGPFFPAFLFSGLTRRGGSISGAVLYHGLSNAFSAFLVAGYRGG